MAAVLNGMSLHGGFRVYGSTFLVFSDYLRPALRLSALMRQPVVYLLTHDSVAVGEDGPTHQPVEHVESLRLIPGLTVLRPADDVETAAAWRQALATTDGPTAIVLTRQAVPSLGAAPARFLPERGGRVVRDVGLARRRRARQRVGGGPRGRRRGPARRAGRRRPGRLRAVAGALRRAEYRHTPRAPLTVSVEAGVTSGWAALAAVRIGVDGFGASGKAADVLAHVGLTPHDVAARVREALSATPADPARNPTRPLPGDDDAHQPHHPDPVPDRGASPPRGVQRGVQLPDPGRRARVQDDLPAGRPGRPRGHARLRGGRQRAGRAADQARRPGELVLPAGDRVGRARRRDGVRGDRGARTGSPPSSRAGKYLLAFDPLDGSSNVDVNVTVGSIFSITRAREPGRRRHARRTSCSPDASRWPRATRSTGPRPCSCSRSAAACTGSRSTRPSASSS